MEVNISITKADVFNDVERKAEYIGKQTGSYNELLIEDGNEDLLNQLFTDAVTNLRKTVRWYVSAYSNTDTICEITLLMTSNYKSSAASEIQQEAYNYCVDYILSEWMNINGMQTIAQYAQSAADHLHRVDVLLSTREMPKRVNASKTTYPTVEIVTN